MSKPSSPYQLIEQPERHPGAESRRSAVGKRAYVIVLLVMTLVLGAWYAPLLWSTVAVEAKPAALGNTRFLEARALQIDSSLLTDQEALADLYQQITPSVVSIQVTSRAQAGMQIPGFRLPQEEAPLQQGQGSGFIFDNEGHIVTNNHVVEGAEEVTVVFYNGFWATAEVVATDPQADLAVLRCCRAMGTSARRCWKGWGDRLAKLARMLTAGGCWLRVTACARGACWRKLCRFKG